MGFSGLKISAGICGFHKFILATQDEIPYTPLEKKGFLSNSYCPAF